MAYTKRYVGGFVDLPAQTTAIDAAFLNAAETSLLRLDSVNPTADAQPLVWNAAQSKYIPGLLTNASIDPAAGIARSKLGALNIVDADVATGAALALSKLGSSGTIGASPITIAAAGKTALQIADSGAQLSGITIGGDTNAYRYLSGILGSDGDLEVRIGTANRLRIGFVSSVNAPGIQMGTTYDAAIWRDAAAVIGQASNLKIYNAAGDLNPQIALIRGTATIQFGPGGATVPDVSLARQGVSGLGIFGNGAAAASLTIDPNSGTQIAQILLAGRNAGVQKLAQFYCDSAGNLLLNPPTGGSNIMQVAGVTVAQFDTTGLTMAGTLVVKGDHRTAVASVTTARTGGAAAALPANPVRYLAMQDENGNRMYVPAYS